MTPLPPSRVRQLLGIQPTQPEATTKPEDGRLKSAIFELQQGATYREVAQRHGYTINQLYGKASRYVDRRAG